MECSPLQSSHIRFAAGFDPGAVQSTGGCVPRAPHAAAASPAVVLACSWMKPGSSSSTAGVLLWLPALLLAIAWGSCRVARAADIISSSKLETCVADGTPGANASAITCRQKLVVVVAVDSGDSIANQQLSFQLSCFGSPTGQCPCPCNYAADAACTCRDLAASIDVKLTKGPLWASYPLQYLQSFNYKPYEAIVRPGPGNCKDGAFEDFPTCGWYYSLGQRVGDSQGFCCECESGLIWDTTFGTNTQRTRANLDCDFFSDPLDILIGRMPCSAHCLMMDAHWYGGYSLGEAGMQFEITASINTTAAADGSGALVPGNGETLRLSPSLPVAVSSNRTLAAKLLGDLAGYKEMPVLSERVLMIPHPKSGQSMQEVFANRTEWMLMDRSRITFDGTECDKVGTSFTAFRFQTGGCRRAPQVCLSNQLKDILEADRARVTAGRVPLYLVSQYTYGLASELKTFNGGPLSFALPVQGIRSSLVQLEAAAEGLRFITNTSPGRIVAARMCTFAETRCGGFEASAARGYLHAWIANTGTLSASYTLAVTNCSVNVTPVEAQRVALGAGQNGTIPPFQIFVEDDAAVQSRYCWLRMLDSQVFPPRRVDPNQGVLADEVLVSFFTNATAYEDWPTGGLLGNGTGEGNVTRSGCAGKCSNKFDVLCAVKNKCWGNVGSLLGLVLGGVAGLALLALALKFGWLTALFQCCGGGGAAATASPFSCCCGGDAGVEDKRKRTRQQQQAQEEEERARRSSRGRHSSKGRHSSSGHEASRRSSRARGGSAARSDSSGSEAFEEAVGGAGGKHRKPGKGKRHSSHGGSHGQQATDGGLFDSADGYARGGGGRSGGNARRAASAEMSAADAYGSYAWQQQQQQYQQQQGRGPRASGMHRRSPQQSQAAVGSGPLALDDYGSSAQGLPVAAAGHRRYSPQESMGGAGRAVNRQHSSSAGGGRRRPSSGQQQQEFEEAGEEQHWSSGRTAQPWDDSAAGGYGQTGAAAAAARIKVGRKQQQQQEQEQPRAYASGDARGGSSPSGLKGRRQQPSLGEAAYQPGSRSLAGGSIPAMWSPAYEDGDDYYAEDEQQQDAPPATAAYDDGEADELDYVAEQQQQYYEQQQQQTRPPRAQAMPARQAASSPGGGGGSSLAGSPQQQRRAPAASAVGAAARGSSAGGRSGSSRAAAAADPVRPARALRANPADVYLGWEGEAFDERGRLTAPSRAAAAEAAPYSRSHSRSPSMQVGSVEAPRPRREQQWHQQHVGGYTSSPAGSSSPGPGSPASRGRSTPGRAVLQSPREAPAAAGGGVRSVSTAAAALVASWEQPGGPGGSSRSSPGAMASSRSSSRQPQPSIALQQQQQRPASASGAYGSEPGTASRRDSRVPATRQSPFAAAAGTGGMAGAGRTASPSAVEQQRRAPSRKPSLEHQPQLARGGVAAAAAAWETAGARGSPRSPSVRPRSSSSSSGGEEGGGLSGSGTPSPARQQQPLHNLHQHQQQPNNSARQQQQPQQQQRRGASSHQASAGGDFFLQ